MIRLLLVSFLSVMFSMGSTQGQDLDGEALAMGYGQSPSEYPPVPDDLVTVDLASGIVGPSIRHLWRSVYLRSLPSEEVARCDASRARPRDFGPLSAELLASLRDGDPAIRDRALRSVKSISGMSESIENEVARTARFNAGELAAAGNDRVKAARARIQIAGSEDGVAAAVRILSESGLGFLGDEPPPVSSRELSTQSRFEPGTLIAQIEEGLSRGGRLRFVPDRDEIRRALGVLERFVDSNGYARLDGESQEPATGIGDVASTMYQGNRGITQMMADTAARDPVFSARCLRFYRELSRIDHRSGAVSDKGTQVDVWATPDGPDVWALAMAEQGENPLEAIRCVGLLGHDNAARLSSGGGNRWVSLFNGFNPADSSRLFEPGSLSGLNVSSQTAGR